MSRVVSWRAPGRINLIGEHTDYNDGFVLPLAIADSCLARVTFAPPGSVRITSQGFAGPVEVPPGHLDAALPASSAWARYPLGVLWAMQNRLGARAVPAGLDIALSSTVPSGAGLSSSAAVLCAVACAVDDLLRLGLSEAMLLDITRAAENEFVGAPTGGMDQLASLRGVAGHVLFCDMRAMTSEPVPLDLPAAGLRLLVVDTRAAHRHADGQYRERRSACERASAALGVPALRDATPTQVQTLSDPLLRRRARHVVTENARVEQTAALLRAGRVRELGPLLDASQLSMADDFEISVAEVDVAVAALRDSGALGARMTGGGFGGCVLALVEDEAVEPTAAAVVAAFARHGFEPPTWAVHTPSAGARRVGD